MSFRRSTLALTIALPALLLGCGLPPPDGLKVEEGVGKLTISWDEVEGADYYRLYVTSDGSDPVPGESEKLNEVESPFVHGGLAIGTEYKYVAVSVDDRGRGGPSEVASGTPQAPTTVGTLVIRYQMCCANPIWGYALGFALWISDADGNYVDTITHYRYYQSYSDSSMPVWQGQRVSDMDGISEATVYPGDRKEYVWDGLDREGNELPLGTYSVWLEVNDSDFPNAVSVTRLDLGWEPLVGSEVNFNVEGEISYEYAPRL
jgi:hypothetical protein